MVGLALGLSVGALFASPAPVSHAQTPVPTITLSARTGPAGSVIEIQGTSYSPGNYTGSVLWDGDPIDTFTIPDGGTFRHQVVLPLFAQQRTHQITVCAGSPCFTGEFAQQASADFSISQGASLIGGQIAYLYQDNTQSSQPLMTAQSYQRLLSPYGIDVVLVPLSELVQTSLTRFGLVMVGPETGALENWGTPAQVTYMKDNARHVMGLGEGGYAFFGQLDLAIGHPNGRRQFLQDIVARDASLLAFKTPHDFSSVTAQSIRVYPDTMSSLVIPEANQTGATLTLTDLVNFGQPSRDATAITEGCYTLWGGGQSPEMLSQTGQALLINAIHFALTTPCDLNLKDFCSALDGPPSNTPGARVLHFDELENGQRVEQLYQERFGLTFESNTATTPIVYAVSPNDPGKARSAPNVIANNAATGTSSNNVPLGMDFAQDKSHVGAWIGNGGTQNLQAILRVYDRTGGLICSTSRTPVPEIHTSFIGLYDAKGRIARVELDYGDTALSESIDDLVFVPSTTADLIQVCQNGGTNGCTPVANAPVHVIRNGSVAFTATSDANGYLLQRNQIEFGDQLWAQVKVNSSGQYTLYNTTRTPVTVDLPAFQQNGTMTVDASYPLILWDLTLSAQWDMSSDTAYQAALIDRVVEASNHLYDFTDGQMALGRVTVYQNYDQWDSADIRLYASNSVHPSAVIGGIVSAQVTDPTVPEVTYYPGQLYMGREWSRTGAPVASRNANQAGTDDWAIVLAHELGHYLLYLFDTYLGLDANNDYVDITSCTGSAMGVVYETINTEFVANPVHWANNCANTLANQTLNRTEWATIRLWYSQLLTPIVADPGPLKSYVPLTQVTLTPPSVPASDPVPSNLFNLDYENGEAASPVARGLIIRNDRVLDQGQPISGTTQLLLSSPQVGDRFCLFDVSSNTGESRNQFGCEILASGDNTLTLEKDTSWEPYVEVTAITSQTVLISVTQPISSGTQLRATLYPEDANTPTDIALTSSGDLHTGTFVSPISAASAYVAVYVDETAVEEDPRREVITDYGVGGSGAEGPTSIWGGAPIISGDGQAGYTPPSTDELEEGEFIAWQITVGRPEPLPQTQIRGNVYRLLAQPPTLAQDGDVSIRLRQGLTPGRSSAANVGLYYWTGSVWQRLESNVVFDREEGVQLLAPSQGVGTYAILQGPGAEAPDFDLYLPQVER